MRALLSLKVEKLIEDIRQQLVKDFQNISWMDKNTTRNAELKVRWILYNSLSTWNFFISVNLNFT